MKFIKSIESYRIIGDKDKALDLPNRFLETIELRGLSLCTVRAYGYDLVHFYRWFGGKKRQFRSIQQKDLFDYIAWQRLAKAQPKSINRRLTTCELFYSFCFGRKIPGRRQSSFPSAHYKGAGRESALGLWPRKSSSQLRLRVKEPKKLVEPLQDKQVFLFLEQFHRYRDLAIVLAMLLCGLRSREVLSLKLDDVNLPELQIRVHGKGNRERMVPMPQGLQCALERYLQLERPLHCATKAFFVVLQGKRRGNTIKASALRSLFRRKRITSRVYHANPHRMRHTFGASMAKEGVRLPILQKLMGHADGATTLQYINLSMTDIAVEYKRAIRRIENRYQQSTVLSNRDPH